MSSPHKTERKENKYYSPRPRLITALVGGALATLISCNDVNNAKDDKHAKEYTDQGIDFRTYGGLAGGLRLSDTPHLEKLLADKEKSDIRIEMSAEFKQALKYLESQKNSYALSIKSYDAAALEHTFMDYYDPIGKQIIKDSLKEFKTRDLYLRAFKQVVKQAGGPRKSVVLAAAAVTTTVVGGGYFWNKDEGSNTLRNNIAYRPIFSSLFSSRFSSRFGSQSKYIDATPCAIASNPTTGYCFEEIDSTPFLGNPTERYSCNALTGKCEKIILLEGPLRRLDGKRKRDQ